MKYPNLLAPLVLPNGVVLRNRMSASTATNNFTQGSERFPTEATIAMITDRARNGASYITMSGVLDPDFVESYDMMNEGNDFKPSDFFSYFDVENPQYRNYLVQMSEITHMYNSKLIMQLQIMCPWGYDVCTTHYESQSYMALDREAADASEQIYGGIKELTPEMIEERIELNVRYAVALKMAGFDGVQIHMSYVLTMLGRLMNGRTNQRTDEYGGSLENRCRASLDLAERIKKACGSDFLVTGSITGYDPDGWSTEECAEFIRMSEGKYDLFTIRHWEGDPHHPAGFEPDNPYPNLEAAARLKEAGVKIPIEVMSGFCDPDDMERVLAEGKADGISGARMWISNPDLGKCVLEGRPDDVVPCLRCNRCHRGGLEDIGATHCSVNPAYGYENKFNRLFPKEISRKKKVAVVGGGPDGMRAAFYASERGHDVTLYEKSDKLGGLLKHVDKISFKWTQARYLDYLIRHMEKNHVRIVMNTEATAEMLRNEGFDAVIIAVGSEPVKPDIPGIDLPCVRNVLDAYDYTEEMGQNVVIIGGGEVGVETGMYLAENGRNATVLEMKPMLASNATFFHYYSQLMNACHRLPGFHSEVNALTLRIEEDGVVYRDNSGEEHKVPADTVIYSVGMRSKKAEALALADSSAYEWYFVGDCETVGNLQKNLRKTYGTAMRL